MRQKQLKQRFGRSTGVSTGPQRTRLSVEPLEQKCLLSGAAQLLYVGIDDAASSPTNSGLLMVADIEQKLRAPLRAQRLAPDEGFSGLGFQIPGEMVVTTSSGPSSHSNVVRFRRDDGTELSRFQIRFGAEAIGIGDLAVQPGSTILFGVRSSADGTGNAGQLFRIDAHSGDAVLVGDTGLGVDGGIAFAPDGTLYIATEDELTSGPRLHTLDPSTADVLTTTNLTLPMSLGPITGLAIRSDGLFVASEAQAGRIVTIDPNSGVVSTIDFEDTVVRGIAGDVAFEPTENSEVLNQVYFENFENGNGGYTFNNMGGSRPGLWHFSVGRRDDGLQNHSISHSWYYGRFETSTGGGFYDTFLDHEGVLISPEIEIPACGVSSLSFSYLLETRPELQFDHVDVAVDDGTSVVPILSRQDGTLTQTTRQKWLTSTSDLTQFAGEVIRLRFSFDTGDPPLFDPEGWYVDDIRITNMCDPRPDIAGYKWNDVNADGLWDWNDIDSNGRWDAGEGENGLNGWTVELHRDDNDDLISDGLVAITATRSFEGNDGYYAFDDVATGKYLVREVISAGEEQVFPGPATFQHVVNIDPPAGTKVSGAFGQTLVPNFGNFIPDISGFKWADDGNGVWDSGEIGVNGHEIELYLDDGDSVAEPGELVRSTTTRTLNGSDGYFAFGGLSTGTYIVREVISAGEEQVFPGPATFQHVVNIDPPAGTKVSGAFGQTQVPNFGNFIPDISGFKWADDGNGVWDSGEIGVNGREIELYLDDGDSVAEPGELVRSTTTSTLNGSDGYFAFGGLSTGTYIVREASSADQTYPGSAGNFQHVVLIDPANGVRVRGQFEATTSPNFGNSPTDIVGYKWDDWDRDGEWDGNEPPLADWRIYLDENGDDIFNFGEPEATTDSAGRYQFDGLSAGTYVVREEPPNAKWEQTFPAFGQMESEFGEHEVEIDPLNGLAVMGVPGSNVRPNFGNAHAEISGYKWNDLNFDGLWDGNEPALNGRVIFLDNGNNLLDVGEPQTVTQNDGERDGAFWFSNLAPGLYVVREVGTTDQTYPGPLDFEHGVSIDPPNGIRTIGDFQATEAPNFGNSTTSGTISGVKFDDEVSDGGPRESGEPGIPGYEIRAYLDVNENSVLDAVEVDGIAPAAFAITDANGEYELVVPPGNYVVVEVLQQPPQTFPRVVVNQVDGGLSEGGYVETVRPGNEITGRDFGNEINPSPLVAIEGTKFHDANGDGVRNGNEGPTDETWDIVAYRYNGNVLGDEIVRVTTSETGFYELGFNVEGGSSYIVLEESRGGWTQTFPDFGHVFDFTDPADVPGPGTRFAGRDFGNRRTCLTKRCQLSSSFSAPQAPLASVVETLPHENTLVSRPPLSAFVGPLAPANDNENSEVTARWFTTHEFRIHDNIRRRRPVSESQPVVTTYKLLDEYFADISLRPPIKPFD